MKAPGFTYTHFPNDFLMIRLIHYPVQFRAKYYKHKKTVLLLGHSDGKSNVKQPQHSAIVDCVKEMQVGEVRRVKTCSAQTVQII